MIMFDQFKKYYYQRPNADYRCLDHTHCKYGPTQNGKCGKSLDPNNQDALCTPMMNPRHFWMRIAKIMALITTVIMMLIFSGLFGHDMLSPGPLPMNHSSIENCENCHIDTDNFWNFPILHKVYTLKLGRDNKVCLTCHDLGENPKNPHNKARYDLATHNNFIKQRPWYRQIFGYIFGPTRLQTNTGDCMQCHRGHGSTAFSPGVENNEVCSQCHLNYITDFTKNHVEFTNYPFKRRGRIIFDHAHHFEKYAFLIENPNPALGTPPTDCQYCHTLTANTDKIKSDMSLKPFEQTCGVSCHVSTVTGYDAPGIKPQEIINIPMIDIASLQAKGAAFGAYPKLERGKGWFSPFVDYMITENYEITEIMNKWRPRGLDKLSNITPEEAKEIQAIIYYYKLVLTKIINGEYERIEIMETIPRDLVQKLVNNNFGKSLPREVEQAKQGKYTPISLFNPLDSEFLYPKQNWTISRNALLYRPVQHRDIFLKNWVDITKDYFSNPLLQPSFDRLITNFQSKQNTGACLMCHSQEINENTKPHRTLTTNWVSNPPEKNSIKYTRFKHKPHYETLGEGSCLACHQLNTVSDYYEQFHDLSVTKPDRNFHVISKDTCDLCHFNGGAPTDCKTCHLYHGKPLPATMVPVSIEGVNIVHNAESEETEEQNAEPAKQQ